VPEDITGISALIAAKAAECKRLAILNRPLVEKRHLLAEVSRHRTTVARAFTMRNIPTDENVRRMVLAKDPAQSEAMKFCHKCLDWRKAQARPTSLIGVMLGNVDSGKTSALARAVAMHADSAFYIRADLLPSPRVSLGGWVSRSQEDQIALRDLIMSADFLAIDEIGNEENPEWITKACLLRYDLRKATILAGNLTGEEFGKRYPDPRLATRTKERQGLPFASVVHLTEEHLYKNGLKST
jgi:DNA replication protein DnaC